MGEMLLLALNSMPTARSTPAGSELWTRRQVRSWKDVVRVREVEVYETRSGMKEGIELQLELVFQG